MNTQATLESLRHLKLKGMADCYQAIIELPVNRHPASHELIAQLAQAEEQRRRTEKMKLFLRLSKLRYNTLLEEISCSAKRNLSQEQLLTLADCSYISRGQNILITGATGCGKSYLACALGHQACMKGYRVLYLNLNRFMEKINTSKVDGSYLKILNQLEKTHLVILDDFGLQPLEHQAKLALLQLLEDRYGNKPVIITSQLPVGKWHEYLNEPTLADAILDRLTANAHRFELKGESLRNSKMKKEKQ